MIIKLNSQDTIFRNELIFTADAKAVNIDYTLVNLFMLLSYNGVRPKQRATRDDKTFIDWDRLKKVIGVLEEEGSFVGFNQNPEAVELWLRSNLLNLANRGKLDQEKIAALRPIHLESYKVRNAKVARDYFTADQIYLMLSVEPKIKEELKEYLSDGWDKTTDKINENTKLDVDSLGILHLVKNVKTKFLDSATNINRIKPILEGQSKLFCDDIRRLLVYQKVIPRNVLIDYLKTIISFHLSIYIQKLILYFPKMLNSGSVDFTDNWTMVLDVTDNYSSRIAKIAVKDAENIYNHIYDYIKATFQINATLRYLSLDKSNSQNLLKALQAFKNRDDKFDTYFKVLWDTIYLSLDDENKTLIDDLVKYENTYFDKYVELLIRTRGGYQYRFHTQFIDNVSQKNTERGFISQGRSRKHPRKYTLGTRLLETLVQILVLEYKDIDFITVPLSIDDLIRKLKERYGIVISGLNDDKFQNSDLNTNLAFRENVEAFKNKLRQIGFYSDLSDAYILQKVRPRYEIN
jgi:hypothetical protein